MVQSVRGPGDFVKSILDAQGWSTSLFDDPASAWQAFVFAEPRPVLLVCDILDGLATTLELVRRCREIEPSLNTVLLGDCPVAELRADDMVAAGNMLSLHCCGPLLVQEVRRILAARRPRIPQPL